MRRPRVFHPKRPILLRKLGDAEDLPQRLPVAEDHPTAELHPLLLVVRPVRGERGELGRHVVRDEGVIAGEPLGREVGHQHLAGAVSGAGIAGSGSTGPGISAAQCPSLARFRVRLPEHGANDPHGFAGRGLVGDHGVGGRPAASRPHALAIRARVHDHLLARLQHCGGAADRGEWALGGAGIVVRRARMLASHVIGAGVRGGVVPEGEGGAGGHEDG